MTDEVLRDRECPGSELTETSSRVTVEPAQFLTGLTVGLPTTRVVCVGCTAQLAEGRAVTVYGYRRAESSQWNLRRCYCTDCAPSAIGEPTLGVTELLAQAWLGTVSQPETRSHRLCLTAVEMVDHSPPQEGTRP